MQENRTLDISWETILKIGFTLIVFYFAYLIRSILVWIFFAFIIAVLFEPVINFFEKRKILRSWATVTIYFALFGLLSFLIYLIAPIFITEIQQFTQIFPQYFEKFSPPLKNLGIEAFQSFEIFTKSLQDWLIKASSSIFAAIISIFGGIFATFSIFVLAIFFSLEKEGTEKIIKLLSPKEYEDYFLELLESCEKKISVWFGVRLLGGFFVGFMVFLAAYIFKIKYAITFGILSGLLDIVPVIGPIISGAIIIIFSLLESWTKALFLIIALILIHQIEASILTPILTKKFIGLSPALVLISLMIGGKLWGILGAILAIPLAGVIYEFLRDFLQERKGEEKMEVAEPQ